MNAADSCWYYSEDGKRLGPISQDALLWQIKTRKLSPNTWVWRTGLHDWIPVFQSELANLTSSDTPPPLSAKAITNGYAWALALAPIWSMFLIYILAYFYLRAVGNPYLGTAFEVIALQQVVSDRWSWYFGWGLNATIALLDDRSLKAGGGIRKN